MSRNATMMMLAALALAGCQRRTPLYPQGMTACTVELPGAAGRCEPIGDTKR